MTRNKDQYSITTGDVRLIVESKAGGRVVSFTLNDYEFLSGKEIHQENYGSTFWSSPQSDWNWPPPVVLDLEPYAVKEKVNAIQCLSGIDPITGLQFEKEFSAGGKNRINISFSMVNASSGVKKTAPWQITRVHKGGLFFFPIGVSPMGKKHFEPVKCVIENGIVWYKDDVEKPETNRLSIADGSEGWVAYAIDGRVLVKQFEDLKPEQQVPGEAEVLLYVSAEADYLELEIQGKYESLKPGERASLNVGWIGARLPRDMRVERGNKALIDFVRKLVRVPTPQN